jgi:hypothetical protein
MALWNGETWVPLNEKTDYRTDYTPEDFASQFPADRPVEQWITFTVNSDGVATGLTYGKVEGTGRYPFLLNNTNVGNISSFAQQKGFTYSSGVESKAQELGGTLTENFRRNQEDLQNRTTQANTRNTNNTKLNTGNAAINQWSNQIISKANAGPTGSYINNRTNIENYSSQALDGLVANGTLNQNIVDSLKNLATSSYKNYYTTERISPWDAKAQGLQPPTGGFQASYYISTGNQSGLDLKAKWQEAVANDNLDLLARYGSLDNYAFNHYSTVGKSAGYRGNPAKPTQYADSYKEKFSSLPNAEKQYIRTGLLGLAPQERERGDRSDTQYAIDWDDKTGSVLEKEVIKNINEQQLGVLDKFSAVTRDALQTTVNKLKEVRQQERDLDIYNSLPGYSEIFNINSSLANTLLGDSGLGGYLGMMGVNTTKFKRGLEEDLAAYTGVDKGYATYDWNKWFNEELVKRYETIESVEGRTAADAQYAIDEQYRQDFIENYLKPRFDNSKSMDEFVGYLTTTQNDQNVFEAATAAEALRNVASERAAAYLDEIKSLPAVGFNPTFYMYPTGTNDAQRARYAIQRKEISEDFAAARANGNAIAGDTGRTWNEWAYYYGLNLNNTQEFARLHYDIIGRTKGFDPAKNVITDRTVKNYISRSLIPALAEVDVDWDAGEYLAFVTPEEFADSVIEGINPEENQSAFKELIDTFGLEQDAGLDAVKDYLSTAFTNGEAKVIRESIAYLNQQQITPTQKELGVTYIERAEDDKYRADPKADELYTLFSQAGYGGTVDEFYESFMPDADRSALELISRTNRADLELRNIDTSDPFETLSDLNKMFGTDDEDIFGTKKETTQPKKEVDYFNLFGEQEKQAADKKKSTLGFDLDTSTDYYGDVLSLFQ